MISETAHLSIVNQARISSEQRELIHIHAHINLTPSPFVLHTQRWLTVKSRRGHAFETRSESILHVYCAVCLGPGHQLWIEIYSLHSPGPGVSTLVKDFFFKEGQTQVCHLDAYQGLVRPMLRNILFSTNSCLGNFVLFSFSSFPVVVNLSKASVMCSIKDRVPQPWNTV